MEDGQCWETIRDARKEQGGRCLSRRVQAVWDPKHRTGAVYPESAVCHSRG